MDVLSELGRRVDVLGRYFGLVGDDVPEVGPRKRRYDVLAVVLAVAAVWIFAARAWDTRGAAFGIAVGVLMVVCIVVLSWPRRLDPHRVPFAERHPYLDASVGIPLGIVLAFFFFPHWPVWRCLVLAAAYAALVFAATRRRVRRARRPGGPPATTVRGRA